MELGRRRVSEIMRREVVTLAAKETLDLSQDLMSLGRVRHLPVLDDAGRLVGIVSSRDLFESSLSKALDIEPVDRRSFLRSVEVARVMSRDVRTLRPDATLGEAARLLVQHKIGCLPVVGPDGVLLGLVTETDLLEAAYGGGRTGEDPKGRTETMQGSEFSDWVQGEVDELRRMRDELKVQAHLGKAEVRERWSTLEQRFERLEQSARRASQAAGGSLRELEKDARQLARDLREGFRRIRDAI